MPAGPGLHSPLVGVCVRRGGAVHGQDLVDGLDAALELMPFAVVVVDADLVVTSANRWALRAVRDGRDPVGAPFLTGPLGGAWTPPVAPLIGMAATGGTTARGVHTNRGTGGREVITVTPDHDGAGGVRGLTVVAQAADAAAEEVERLGTRVRFLEAVFEGLPAAAFVADRETGVVLAANAALGDLVGARAAELVGERAPLWFLEGWDHRGPAREGPVTLRPYRGPQRQVRVRGADAVDGRGRVVRTIVVLPDAGTADSDDAPDPAGARAAVAALTPRRREVLELLCQGFDTRAIAHRLVISEHTARNHVQAVLRQLGCRSRLAAAAIAFQAGLCGPPGDTAVGGRPPTR